MPLDRPIQYQSNNNSGIGVGGHFKSNLVSSIAAINLKTKDSAFPFTLDADMGGAYAKMVSNVELTEANSDMLPNSSTSDLDSFQHGNLDSIGDILLPTSSDPMKTSPNTDYLSVSPSFGPWSLSFDNKIFEETTPDEFAPINFLKGISNINYDFISDNSGENSISEDVGGDVHANQANNDPVKTSDSTSSFNLDEFDPLRCTDNATASTPSSSQSKPMNIVLIEPKPTTLIESEDSPNQVQLPSPLKPTATDYKGFSNSQIPTISCNTGNTGGDFSSLNSSDVNHHQS